MTAEEDIGKIYEVGRQFGHEAFPEYAWKLAFLCTREDMSSQTEQVVFAGYYPDGYPLLCYQYELDSQMNVFFP